MVLLACFLFGFFVFFGFGVVVVGFVDKRSNLEKKENMREKKRQKKREKKIKTNQVKFYKQEHYQSHKNEKDDIKHDKTLLM